MFVALNLVIATTCYHEIVNGVQGIIEIFVLLRKWSSWDAIEVYGEDQQHKVKKVKKKPKHVRKCKFLVYII